MNTNDNINENTNNISPEMVYKYLVYTQLNEADEKPFLDVEEEKFKSEKESFEFFMNIGETKRAEQELERLMFKQVSLSVANLFANTYCEEGEEGLKKSKGKLVLDMDKVPCRKNRILWAFENNKMGWLDHAVCEISRIVQMTFGITTKSIKFVCDGKKLAKVNMKKQLA